MTDDELTERLARSLHAHAATVSSPPDAWDNFVHQAGHTLPSGAERRRRARWLPAAVVTSAIAVAAAALFVIFGSPPSQSSKVKFATNPPAPTTTAPAPATTAPPSASPTTVAPPAVIPTVPATGPRGGPVPKGFTPVSVTFVSLKTGWVLGTAPCVTPPCTSMLSTNDGGKTWVGIPAPITALSQGSGGPGVRQVRFANLLDGWAFGPELWATHDGGARWHQVTINGVAPGSPVMSLEAANGLVHAAVLGDQRVWMATSQTDQDNWVASPTTVPVGAGPVPNAQIVLQGGTGWLIEVDRTVTGGARLDHGRWAAWQPPCQAAGGPATLAASNATAMVALCQEGIWTGPAIVDRVYLSSDGGTSFHQAAMPTPSPGSQGLWPVATPSPQTIVVGDSTGTGGRVLLGSFDGGKSWKTVAHYQQPAAAWADLGFTSPTQGVAVLASTVPSNAGTLLMTTDGGKTWNPVTFRQAALP